MSVTNTRSACLFQVATLVSVVMLLGACSVDEDVRVEDRLLLQEALAQYPYLWDGKDSEGFANLFTEDGIMEQYSEGELVPGSIREGRQAILEYARQSHTGRLADRQTRHHFSALVFLELTSAQAVTENMALITHQTAGPDPAFISSSGIYRITWRKTTEGWKMQRRQLYSDGFATQ